LPFCSLVNGKFPLEHGKRLTVGGWGGIFVIMVVERGNNSESVISTPNLRFGNKFSKKI
jgi:hypothetical protein